MRQQLEQLLLSALRNISATHLAAPPDPAIVTVERTRDTQHGDFATNVAMRLAKAARRNPRELAQAIVAALPANAVVARTEVAGAGFINFFLTPEAYARELVSIHEAGDAYGRNDSGAGQRVQVEFVSANPTGPLHVGHGRQAAVGATLANVLAANGYEVGREYYINDAGRQMDILAVSVWLRYIELFGETFKFPENGYRGDYVRVISRKLQDQVGSKLKHPAAKAFDGAPPDAPEGDKDEHIDFLIERCRALIGAAAFHDMLVMSRDEMLADIRDDLKQFGVEFDVWYSEASLGTSGAIDRALERLRGQGRLYEKDGATWFRATDFGDEKDRVVVRENGVKTYFASDIAYHNEKRARGFGKLIDVLGADHHGYVARVRAGLVAMGEPGDCLEAVLIQFVSLFRNGEKVSMGKREANFVTLRELREEVGTDACRIFYLMRSHDQHLDFDLELAKKREKENPMYYIQYAHARVSSVMKELKARGWSYDQAMGFANLPQLTSKAAHAVFTEVTRYPEVVALAAANRTPHTLVHYLRDLANALHTWYDTPGERWLIEDPVLRNARLALALGVRQVVRNGLTLLGVSAPESM